eukprot:TRINITY_DN30974_c0_g1_i1.p1 TRINITY_DN30974_c0_g1~~TRINITY_DN30974_c0_g1_i1.p1  ORF type:complete len:348 (+),score=50.73 TRINITY_DN30974_c0_g1_i1:55-1098(+)
MKKQAYLIDAPIFFFRYYCALPKVWKAPRGEHMQGAYGYTLFLLDLLSKRPEYIAAAFDGRSKDNWRKTIHSEYKENRASRGGHSDIRFQMEACKDITEALGVGVYTSAGYEADDVIGSLHKLLEEGKVQTHIASSDKDLMQLVGRRCSMYDVRKKVEVIRGPAELREQLGFDPRLRMADYLALVGDKVDNINGVPSLGKATAQAIFAHTSVPLSKLIEDPSRLKQVPIRGAGSLPLIISSHKDLIERNLRLTNLSYNAPCCKGLSLPQLLRVRPQEETILNVLTKYGFDNNKQILSKVEKVLDLIPQAPRPVTRKRKIAKSTRRLKKKQITIVALPEKKIEVSLYL